MGQTVDVIPFGQIIADISIFILQLGTLIAYLLFIGKSIRQVLI